MQEQTGTLPEHADYLLTGGSVFDGAGGAPVPADVAITGDRISAISEGLAGRMKAGRVIDVAGKAVAPGFIDIHTHSDLTILLNPRAESSIHQGVTTEVMGNCGMSVAIVGDGEAFWPERRWIERGGLVHDWDGFADFFSRVEDKGIAINMTCLVGHGTIRKRVMGMDNRPPSETELAEMRRLMDQACRDGVVGLSTGLEYLPGGYAQPDEICALAEIAHEAGGFYASHLRNEGDTLAESVEEALAVARRTGIPAQVSHHKAEGRRNWGKVAQTLAMMDRARRDGLDVLTDQYPYTAFMTGLGVIMLPAWANAGTLDDTTARLTDTRQRELIRKEIQLDPPVWDQIFVGVARVRREAQGLSLAQIGAREGKEPVDAALDLLVDENGMVACAYFALCEEDVEAVLRDPHTMIGSDGVTAAPGTILSQDKTHPRTYGTFPRVLGAYVRERSVLPLAEAIRRMTTLPARRLGLTDRGRLAAGMKADIVVFDPATVSDRADFDNPHEFSAGILQVFVNGRLAIDGGVQTDALAGRMLRRADISG